MKNSLIVDRARYDSMNINGDGFGGISLRAVSLLDYFIIEEEDGGATFIKDRSYGRSGAFNKVEYDSWKTLVAKWQHILEDDLPLPTREVVKNIAEGNI